MSIFCPQTLVLLDLRPSDSDWIPDSSLWTWPPQSCKPFPIINLSFHLSLMLIFLFCFFRKLWLIHNLIISQRPHLLPSHWGLGIQHVNLWRTKIGSPQHHIRLAQKSCSKKAERIGNEAHWCTHEAPYWAGGWWQQGPRLLPPPGGKWKCGGLGWIILTSHKQSPSDWVSCTRCCSS